MTDDPLDEAILRAWHTAREQLPADDYRPVVLVIGWASATDSRQTAVFLAPGGVGATKAPTPRWRPEDHGGWSYLTEQEQEVYRLLLAHHPHSRTADQLAAEQGGEPDSRNRDVLTSLFKRGLATKSSGGGFIAVPPPS